MLCTDICNENPKTSWQKSVKTALCGVSKFSEELGVFAVLGDGVKRTDGPLMLYLCYNLNEQQRSLTIG